jgi:multiple sugar transport system permease protein
VIGTIRAFQAFNQVYVMSIDHRGGPLATTKVVTVFIYDTFYGSTRLGYASAAAFILFGIILLWTVLQLRLQRERA